MKLFFLLPICVWAQLQQPGIGTMLDSTGQARPVFGVASSVTLGDPIAAGILSMSCSRARCVAKTDTSIVDWNDSSRTEIPAPPGPALFAFAPDAIYACTSAGLTKNGEPVELHVTGEILSMRFHDGALEFAVRRDDGVWIVHDGDISLASLPDATGPVMLLDGAIVFASGDETILRRPDAPDLRFSIHADAFTRISDTCIQIRSGPSAYALRLDPEKLFQLPEADQ